MTATISVDPTGPGVDGARFRCPGCDQTLDAILAGGRLLPIRHYRQPTTVNQANRIVVVVRHDSRTPAGLNGQLCRYSDDDLARLIFIAQRDGTP